MRNRAEILGKLIMLRVFFIFPDTWLLKMQNRQMNDDSSLHFVAGEGIYFAVFLSWDDLFCRFPQLKGFILPFSSAEGIYSAVFLSWDDLFCRFPQLRWFILPFSSAEGIYPSVFLSWRDLFCRFPQLKGFILSFSYLFCSGPLVLTEGTLCTCKQLLYISAFPIIHYCYVFL